MSSIQWFPGHMHLTRKRIAERLKDIDVVIEVLDARMPGSSANPALAELTGQRPTLKIINKQDMADPACTPQWVAWYEAQHATRALPLDASEPAPAKRLIESCRQLAPGRGGMAKPMRVLICGVPNVGKSTLINSMSGKSQAKTGDEAGVTKDEQRIVLADDFYLWDTPGMLWPKITVPQSGYNLAACGSVGRNAYDDELVALELLQYLQNHYPRQLDARYKLGLDDAQIAALSDDQLLALIGKKRGAVMAGGRINLQKAAELLITDYRTQMLGRITLETPEAFEQWRAAGEAAEALAQEKKRERQQLRKSGVKATRS